MGSHGYAPTNAVTCACGETVFAPTSWIWIAIVDREDGWLLEDYKWAAKGESRIDTFYVRSTRFYHETGKGRIHHAIVDYVQVDHINGNGHDNRKANLREGIGLNQRNARKHWDAETSRFKGVYRHAGKWHARIQVDGRTKSLGYFDFEVDAAIAYNYNAAHLFGEFAKLNPIPEGEWCHD